MVRFRIPRQRFVLRAIVAALTVASASACARTEHSADSAAATTHSPALSTAAPTDSTAGHDTGGMQAMANMTGDADHDFLRMMSDHHKGLIQIAHMTKDRNDVGSASVDATKLDAQTKEIVDFQRKLAKLGV